MLSLRLAMFSLSLGIAALTVGCSSGTGTVTGKVTKGGQPLNVGEKGRVLLIFHTPATGTAQNSHPAEVKADGSFVVKGSNNKGLAPGKYRISVEAMTSPDSNARDYLRGKFSPTTSTIVRDVKPGTEVVIDIDQP